MFKQVAICAVVLFAVVSADDDVAVRRKIVDCINKDIVASNSEWKLPEADLKKFTNIIDREIMKEPLCKKTPEEQMKIVDDIHEASKKDLPTTDLKIIDKMIETLKARGKHCGELVKSKA